MTEKEMIRFLVASLSELGGKVAAIESMVGGLLQTTSDGQAGSSTCETLERAYSTYLQTSTNPTFLGAFEETMRSLTEARQV